jgi:hypothetical protein
MTEPRTVRQRALVVAVAMASAFAAFSVASSPVPTEAAWVVTRTLDVTATAVIPAQPTGLTCGAGSGGLFSSVPFTWTAPAGTAPSGYTLSWTGAATGSASFAGTSGSVPSSALLGTITVRVAANYGTSWISATGTQTRSVTIIAFGTLWSCS